MIKKKKYYLLLLLCFCLALPKEVNAELADSYYISRSSVVKPFHADYTWANGKKSGYLTKAEQKGKQNLKCNSNDVQYYWYYYESTCSLDSSKLPAAYDYCSGLGTGTAKNNTKKRAEDQCKSALALKNMTCFMSSGNSFVQKPQIGWLSATTKTAGGMYAKSAAYYYTQDTSKTKEMCTWGGGYSTGPKDIAQGIFSTDNGSSAYCIHPGKQFINQNYDKEDSFDVSDCKKSNDDYSCGLAAIVAKAEKEYGGDYLTTVTALRFWAVTHGQDDGAWWDPESDQTYDANVYKITTDYIKSSGYTGSSSKPGPLGVIYANSSGISQLQNAIQLFREAEAGFDIWTPKTEVLSTEYNKETGIVEVIVASNFDNTTRIEKITTEPEIGGITFTTETCPANKVGDYCLRISIPVDIEEVKKGIKLKGLIEYNHPDDVISKVGLYKARSNPGKYQYMVVIDKGVPSTVEFEIDLQAPICTFKNGKWYDRDGQETDKQGYLDSCECVEVDGVKYIKYPERPAKSEDEWYEECEKTKCPDKGIDYSLPEYCEDESTDKTIKDPEICTVINREDGNYKTEYGNQFCTIYCRETLTFTFMDKETAIAGRYFKHDVKSKYSNIAYLSTVINSSRQCSSVIDYDTWEESYLSANDAVLSTWNNLKYWESLYNLNGGYPTETQPGGGCSGCLCTQPDHPTYYAYWQTGYWNQTFANGSSSIQSAAVNQIGIRASCGFWHTSCSGEGDSRVCNTVCKGSCSPAGSADLGFVTRNYRSAITSYEGALNRRDTLLYQLQDCNFMSKDPKGTYMDYIENKQKPDKTLQRVYEKKNFYVVGGRTYTSMVELRTYNQVMQYEPGNDVEIDYEENYTYNEGYDITTEDELTPNVVTQMGFSDQGKWEEYCLEDCDYDLGNLVGSSYTKELPFWLCSGSETGALCVDDTKILPSNKLTNIIIERDSLHYQNSAFFTQVYTGHISTSGNSQGYWIPLLDQEGNAGYHLYPVGIKRKTGSYDIKIELKDLGNQDRVVKFEDGELKCAYQVINDLAVYDCDDNYHVCYPCTGPDCYPEDTNKNPFDLGVYFRTIDLSDVFPNSVYSPNYNNRPQSVRPIGKNWTINNSKQIIEQIQKLNTGIWQEKPQYEITLNRETIAEIKKHNKRTNYQNYSLTCEGLYCTSDFLSKDLKEILMDKYSTLYSKDTTIKQSELYNYNR